MFSILQKPQDSVNAEDLETLQNQIERRLVDVVTQKWELERELLALNVTSPDTCNSSASPALTSNATSQSTSIPPTSLISGKLRNSTRPQQNDTSENATDGFRGSIFNSGNNGAVCASGTNSTEDSVGSESSLVSSLTGSTIITASALLESGSHTSSLTGTSKRAHRGNNERPSKRFRQNSSNSLMSSGTYPKRPPHSKHRSKIIPSKFRNSTEESRLNKKQLPRNEAPDKLWPFVEQFCATPTEEQIKELEEMIKSMDNDKEYFKVPAIGKKDSSSKDSPSKSDNGGKNQKKNKKNSEDDAGLGALTQRLVASLIEESDDIGTEISKSNDSQAGKKKNSKSKGNKNIDLNNAKNLERRIRQELEEYEILDQQDDIPYTSEEDEILRELIASQHELLSIQNQNKESMQLLLKRAKRHMELEGEREKLREANADVIASYYRLIQAKQRKRNPTKKEKDAAWKALKVQEAIFNRCDELYMSSLNR